MTSLSRFGRRDVLKKGEVVSLLTASPSSSEGGDVPGGIQKAVGWGDKRGKI